MIVQKRALQTDTQSQPLQLGPVRAVTCRFPASTSFTPGTPDTFQVALHPVTH